VVLSQNKADEAGTETASGQTAGADDIDLVVREAVRRLRSSTLGRGANLGNLPLVFVLGDSGATKTTTVIHSALDPELLAGHVYQDTTVLPTRLLNIWYTRQAIFVTPPVTCDPTPRWKRLVKLVQPGRVSTAMGKGVQAPRAAIVCYDTESFLKPGASETTLSAHVNCSPAAGDFSTAGSAFLCTCCSPSWIEFHSSPSLFAASTKRKPPKCWAPPCPFAPWPPVFYAEEETGASAKLLMSCFIRSRNAGSICSAAKTMAVSCRPLRISSRIAQAAHTPVQFLVDLTRPSQLSVNPFLRGFYFSGVRPVFVEDVSVACSASASSRPGFERRCDSHL